jgi:hypothetical protein
LLSRGVLLRQLWTQRGLGCLGVNQSLSNLEKLSAEILSKLIDQYEQLQFVVLDEVSLVGARMLNAIDQRLRSIKHIQNNFFGGLDAIVTGDFYQTLPIRDI